jgi:hypothetical protein
MWLVESAFSFFLGGTPPPEDAPLLGVRLLCFGIGMLMSPPSRFAPRQLFQVNTARRTDLYEGVADTIV